MKNSFKSNLIIFLLILIIGLVLFNIAMNKSLIKDFMDFNGSDQENIDISSEDIDEFELKIEYKDKKVELKYDLDKNKLDAQYRNDFTNENLTSKEAKAVFDSHLKDIDFKGPESQLVDLILDSLKLSGDFDRFQLEVDYRDNSQVDIDIREY